MFQFDYIGINYTNPPEFTLDNAAGMTHYFLAFFLTDILIRIDGMTRQYPGGTAILYAPGDPQFYHHPQNGFSNDWIQFTGIRPERQLSLFPLPINTPFTVHDADHVHHHIQRMEQEFFGQGTGYRQMLDLMIQELFLLLSREYLFQESSDQNHQIEALLRDARAYIFSHPEQSWTVEEMADLVHLSPSRFSHLYRSVFHISPKQNLLTERMNRARFLIQSQKLSVTEAALRVGYDNIYHFSKQFKKVTGKAPSEYRT